MILLDLLLEIILHIISTNKYLSIHCENCIFKIHAVLAVLHMAPQDFCFLSGGEKLDRFCNANILV